MPVPTTNPSLQDIYDEFGAPAGTPITALVRGGTYVVSGTGTLGIPTTPPIAVLDFAGAFVPAALSIASVQAPSGGSISSEVTSGLTTEFTLTHTSGSGVASASASAVARVNIRVERATTARLAVAPRASNGTVQGIYRSPYSSVVFPLFDDPEQFGTATGPFMQDTTGSSQGTWGLQPPCGPVGLSEADRIAQATDITLSAVANGIYALDFTMTHTLAARIAGGVGFGQSVTRNLAGSRVVFPLSLMFREPIGGALVQEVPINITINCAGSLQATAVDFA